MVCLPILQMEKLRLREGDSLTQEGGKLSPEALLSPTRHPHLSEAVGPGATGVPRLVLCLCLDRLSFPLGIKVTR